MDPVEKRTQGQVTLGDLISYYYDKFASVYENEELRSLAVSTMLDDILAHAAAARD